MGESESESSFCGLDDDYANSAPFCEFEEELLSGAVHVRDFEFDDYNDMSSPDVIEFEEELTLSDLDDYNDMSSPDVIELEEGLTLSDWRVRRSSMTQR